MNFSYSFADSVSRMVTNGACILTDIVVNPSAADYEFKIHHGQTANDPVLIHVKEKTQDTKFMSFVFPRQFSMGMYFEIVSGITDYSLGIQYI